MQSSNGEVICSVVFRAGPVRIGIWWPNDHNFDVFPANSVVLAALVTNHDVVELTGIKILDFFLEIALNLEKSGLTSNFQNISSKTVGFVRLQEKIVEKQINLISKSSTTKVSVLPSWTFT